ncbi:MAG: hypothetical protein D6775_11365, partial [Caldilineae bacterium]
PTPTPTPTPTATPSTGAIELLIFHDLDADGQQGPDELPVAGIPVTLRDGEGRVRSIAISNADGIARFLDLPPGPYTLTVQPPPGFTTTGPSPIVVKLLANFVARPQIGLAPIRIHLYLPLQHRP